jgi:ubiquinone/menaquinone biosynthesis C-methylase UbiE
MQDEIFWKSEGDQWFLRNKAALANAAKVDWVTRAIEFMNLNEKISSVLDIGCADGWRIGKLKKILEEISNSKVSVDVSPEALKEGAARFPQIKFIRSKISKLDLTETFDMVIINSVFHWVDRDTLASAVAEVDRVTADKGYILIGDFLPDGQERRSYHHLSDLECFTYKQNYPAIFEAFGTYKEVLKITYDCESPDYTVSAATSDNRATCVVLKKDLFNYYREKK